MTWFLLGLFAGQLLTLAWQAVKRLTQTPRKVVKKAENPREKTALEELASLRERAEMDNFWLYDGSPQRAPEEIAADRYYGMKVK